ncbi:hypothetical protein VTK26DRAFT_5943 [Humicola hyalothermophila]
MADTPSTPSPETISESEFHGLLERYQACLAEISDARGSKPGQKTLADLDEYRYGTALDAFASGKSDASMGLDHVKTLVEWKLRHGKFRPTLMKLVSSNDSSFTESTIQKSVKHYRENADVPAALKILTQLKGIGPATASLILAVHAPEDVIFFADEAFYWLCSGGSKVPIKYNLDEYIQLNERARALAKRLGVKAVDVERVAFVLLRQSSEDGGANTDKAPTMTRPDDTSKKPPAKRKVSGDEAGAPLSLRRSKRSRRASCTD